jgi:hypothetical protein
MALTKYIFSPENGSSLMALMAAGEQLDTVVKFVRYGLPPRDWKVP